MAYSLKQSIHTETFIFKSQVNAIINLRYGSGISYRLLVIVVNHVITIQIPVLDITWTYFREFLYRTALNVRLISEITDSLPAKTLPDRVTFFRQIAIRLISLTIFYDFTFSIGEVGSDIVVEVLVFLFHIAESSVPFVSTFPAFILGIVTPIADEISPLPSIRILVRLS